MVVGEIVDGGTGSVEREVGGMGIEEGRKEERERERERRKQFGRVAVELWRWPQTQRGGWSSLCVSPAKSPKRGLAACRSGFSAGRDWN